MGLLFLFVFLRLSSKYSFLKRPGRPPFIGGICFSLAFIVSYLAYVRLAGAHVPFELRWLLCFSFILLGLEVIDDWFDLSLKVRVITQILFVVLFLSLGKRIEIYFLPHWANYLVSFLWIMGITNAFNLLDISDGLCGGVSFVAGLGFLVLAQGRGEVLLAGLFLTLCGALFAFILFNFPPAKVYMGNSGSHFLGFLFATLAIYSDYALLCNPFALIAPVFILAIPIIDTIFLIIVRSMKGIIPLKKSDDHIFLRFITLGVSQAGALSCFYLLGILWAVAALLIVFRQYLFFAIATGLCLCTSAAVIIKALTLRVRGGR